MPRLDRQDDAEDYGITGQWEDIESRSLSQAADALGKIASQLKVPPALLLDMVPGLSKTQADEWRRYMRENPSPEERMADALERQAAGEI